MAVDLATAEAAAEAPAEVMVDQSPAERAEKDAKEIAMDKLNNLMKDKSTTQKELEDQIAVCLDAGVPKADVAEAETKVKGLAARAAAINNLHAAINSLD